MYKITISIKSTIDTEICIVTDISKYENVKQIYKKHLRRLQSLNDKSKNDLFESKEQVTICLYGDVSKYFQSLILMKSFVISHSRIEECIISEY